VSRKRSCQVKKKDRAAGAGGSINRTRNAVVEPAEAQDAAAHDVQAADVEERQHRVHVAGWTHGYAERCQVRQQDDALLIQRLLENKMRDFKQGHRTCPKGDEAGVRNVRPNEGARRVDEPSVPGPPSKPC